MKLTKTTETPTSKETNNNFFSCIVSAIEKKENPFDFITIPNKTIIETLKIPSVTYFAIAKHVTETMSNKIIRYQDNGNFIKFPLFLIIGGDKDNIFCRLNPSIKSSLFLIPEDEQLNVSITNIMLMLASFDTQYEFRIYYLLKKALAEKKHTLICSPKSFSQNLRLPSAYFSKNKIMVAQKQEKIIKTAIKNINLFTDIQTSYKKEYNSNTNELYWIFFVDEKHNAFSFLSSGISLP